MKVFLIILFGLVGVTLVAEVSLRLFVGLGKPALYIADDDIGYLLAPNQKLRRGGNRIEINQYSMRHGEIEPQKDSDTKRILLLGDSVVYGTWRTDQTQTLSALLAGQSDRPIEVLNASANSWSPRNELAYLKKYGLFDADVLILVINTDDFFAPKPTSLVVGTAYNYPDQAPPLALIEAYQIFIATPKPIPELEKLRAAKDNLKANIAAIKEIKDIAQQSDTEFILAITPLLQELQGQSTPESIQARKRLQELVRAENIEYVDFLKVWADFPQPEFLYRDRIHPSPQGNTKIVEQLRSFL